MKLNLHLYGNINLGKSNNYQPHIYTLIKYKH